MLLTAAKRFTMHAFSTMQRRGVEKTQLHILEGSTEINFLTQPMSYKQYLSTRTDKTGSTRQGRHFQIQEPKLPSSTARLFMHERVF